MYNNSIYDNKYKYNFFYIFDYRPCSVMLLLIFFFFDIIAP